MSSEIYFVIKVLCTAYSVDRLVVPRDIEDCDEVGVDHAAVNALDFEGLPDEWKSFHKVVLVGAELQAFQEILFQENILLVLERYDGRCLVAGG